MCGDSKALTEVEDQKRAKIALEVERGTETQGRVEKSEECYQADKPPLSKGYQMFLPCKCVQEWPKAWMVPQD